MAAHGGHFASTCAEHITAYVSGTARASWMKFHMYIDLDEGYLYMK